VSKKKTSRDGPFEALRALKEDLEKKAREAQSKKEAPHAPAPKVATAADPEDELLSLHRLFAGVKPLDRSRAGRLPRGRVERSAAAERAATRGAEEERAEADAVHERLRSLVEGTARFEVTDDGEHVEGRRVDVPISALRRLRRGLLPIDGRIDLHRMTVPEARTRLEAFLRTARLRGERCVLVIHGRGQHSAGGLAVLRGEVSAWLSQDACSAHVAAFATARGDDGGEGAVYVLLRK
jgi:DNA-nicking Smr family endonuclease